MATNLINGITQSASGKHQNNDNSHYLGSSPGCLSGASSLSSSSAGYLHYDEQNPSINEPTDGLSDTSKRVSPSTYATANHHHHHHEPHDHDDVDLELDFEAELHHYNQHNHIVQHHNGSNHSRRSKSSVSQPIQVPARQTKRNLNRMKLSMMKEDPLLIGLMADSNSSSTFSSLSNVSNGGGGLRSSSSIANGGATSSVVHLERSSPIEPAIEGVISGLLEVDYDQEATNGSNNSEITSLSGASRRRRLRPASQQRDELEELIVDELDVEREQVDDPFRNGERNRPSIENIAAFDDEDAFLNQEFNASHHNRYPIDEFEREHLTAGEDPMRLFASIQALAKSIHDDDELFGSLPPKRMLESPIRSIALY